MANAHAAGDVATALQEMQQAIATPQLVIDYCAGEFPEYADNLHAAFDLWRRKHADLIFEIETRADRAARRAARRGEEQPAEEGQEDPIKQYRLGYAEKLRRTPKAESQPACAKYGDDLTQGRVNVSDLEKMFSVQLKLIRGKDGARGSN